MQKDRSLFTGEEFIVGSSPYCFKLESPYTVEESRVKSSSSHMRSFLLSSLLLCFWTCVTEEVNKRCIQRDRKPDKNCKVTLLITLSLSLLLLLCTISPSPLKSVAIFLIIINPTHTEPYPGFQWVHISIWSFLIRIYIILQVIYKNTLIQVCHQLHNIYMLSALSSRESLSCENGTWYFSSLFKWSATMCHGFHSQWIVMAEKLR